MNIRILENMSENLSQAQILALALYEIQLLLRDYLGSNVEGDIFVRHAAHLSYALHNEALAVLDGKEFDEQSVISKIKAVDNMFGENDYTARLIELIQNEKT